MNADFYSESFTVKAYECDAEARMTPGAILRRAQIHRPVRPLELAR
ncbi:MAG: hypothetical protein ACLUFF_05845 [Acutalibacteraceae bacterium]